MNMYEIYLFRKKKVGYTLYSKKDKRFLSIKEMLSSVDLGKRSIHIKNIPSDDNYVLTENSAEDISKAVLEYMDFLSSDDIPLTSKQKEYNKYCKQQGHRLLKSNRTMSKKTNSDEQEMRNMYFKRMWQIERLRGSLCSGFLEDYW